MEENEQIVAERDILLVPPSGGSPELEPGLRGFPVTLGIGLPFGDYPGGCKVYFEGFREPRIIRGIDKWQALLMAIKYMRTTLQELEMRGWTLELYDEGDEKSGVDSHCVISVNGLFGD